VVTRCIFDAHPRSFAVLEGIARRGIYDCMLTAVDTMKKGKGRIVNARFAGWLSRLPALVRPFTAFGG